MVDKVIDKIHRDGLRGTAAAAMHQLAAVLDHSKPPPVDAIPPAETNPPLNSIPPAWSEYLSWLSFAVPGMLNRGNVDAMSFALQHLPNDAPMLEIGSFCGLSTCVIAYLRLKHSISNRLFTAKNPNYLVQKVGLVCEKVIRR